jgi:uncharacterized membrane protein
VFQVDLLGLMNTRQNRQREMEREKEREKNLSSFFSLLILPVWKMKRK